MPMRRRLPSPPSVSDRKPRRPARGDFARLVRNAPLSEQDLPLTHVTDAYHLRNIADAGALEPTPCGIFDEPLLYLFYGRPAYRAAGQVETSGLDAYWPICFVLRSAAVAAKRIYPFDSGAFHRGLFADFCHHDMIKEDFELDVDPTTPARLLNLFWANARNYFDNRDALEGTFDPFAFEAKSYSELIRAKANAPFDERHSAIELQSGEPLALSGNLLAVIMPDDFASDAVRARFEALGALVLPFDTVSRHHAGNMVGQIYDICRDLYSGKHGRLKCW